MVNTLLALIKEKYPLTELNVGDAARLKVNGMTFAVSAYSAEGLGHISVMRATGIFGLMRMDTLMITPRDIDLPLYSYDRIYAMGNERARELNRIQAVLEGANIKLSSIVTDISGKSSMEILRAIIDGKSDVEYLCSLAKGSLKGKIPELKKALTGSIGVHQVQMLKLQLDHIDFLSKSISEMDEDIKKNRNLRRMHRIT